MKKAAAKKNPVKRSRLEARVTENLKHRLERAAAIKGMTLSAFVVRSMEQAAAEVIEQHEHRELSEAAQNRFIEALLNPPEPNEKMLPAARRYRES